MANFKQAFAAARKAGKKEFSWNGSKYTTKLKEEAKTAPASSPRPRKKPSIRVGKLDSEKAKAASGTKAKNAGASVSSKQAAKDKERAAKRKATRS